MHPFLNLILITSFIGTAVAADTPADTKTVHVRKEVISPGYSALKLFLEDEQHLTTIRRTKMVVTFSNISESSIKLIDEISRASEQAIEEMENLAHEKPAFSFEDFPDEGIARSTFDSLRYTTAKEFFFDGEDFEKDLLISQLKVLRLISHLASELEETESNTKRKKWLRDIAVKYEKYYQRVSARVFITARR
ncbi:MAG: hypothetical protein IMF14_05305 [Proteobacteria bacterium]|nr:hypothetical protein [Pseudomonadota bacterium]